MWFWEANHKIKYNTKLNTSRWCIILWALYYYIITKKNFITNNPHKCDVFSLGCYFIIDESLNYNFIGSLRNEDKEEELDKIDRSSLEIYYSAKLINFFKKLIIYIEYKRKNFIELEKLINKEFS